MLNRGEKPLFLPKNLTILTHIMLAMSNSILTSKSSAGMGLILIRFGRLVGYITHDLDDPSKTLSASTS